MIADSVQVTADSVSVQSDVVIDSDVIVDSVAVCYCAQCNDFLWTA